MDREIGFHARAPRQEHLKMKQPMKSGGLARGQVPKIKVLTPDSTASARLSS